MPGSALVLRSADEPFDAVKRFNLAAADDAEPAGCLCGQVIRGLVTPAECKLFGTTCTPVQPIGPCMVSGEGTCQAWFKYARGGQQHPARGPRRDAHVPQTADAAGGGA
jgi:hydrogenase expression/formation protein HypD